jgi:hypothetical protein
MNTHLLHKEKHHMTLLKPILASTLLILGCAFASAQTSANEPDANSDASYNYNFQAVNFSGDAFTQLLGINSYSEIAGYHGSGAAGHPNKGFRLTLPKQFASENFPKSAQTQVIGINKRGDTDGFYVDTAGKTHGLSMSMDLSRAWIFPVQRSTNCSASTTTTRQQDICRIAKATSIHIYGMQMAEFS